MKAKRKFEQNNVEPVGGLSTFATMLFLALWLGCFVSALGVVYTTFKSRTATQSLEVLRRESTQLQVASGQYLLEKSSWAAYSRVEQVAVNKLKMKVPKSEQNGIGL